MKQRIMCINDVYMDGDGEIAFTEGRIYKTYLTGHYIVALDDRNHEHWIGTIDDTEWLYQNFRLLTADEITTMEKVYDLSIENEKSLEQIALKMSEEVGEVSQALLSHLKASGSAYKELGANDVIEECVDVMIVAYSLIYKLGGTDADIEKLMREKVNKWEEKVNGL
ncbi:MazG nucleotide pyrophosphohydrolase domain containing protein [Bacillus phage Kirov]|uniref:MazG nucleotide pyrophosphohydrolase domain containing protein n=1 Tax=Bacillus phage Kirov TaxID=2783539 RepID=A0A7U3RZ37_9CAUD|nr:MazG-like pyrophosphatase [Bacillus phage Kirov]QOV08438.1 MazG nucleotide pyrophosphohydrolase domain containing protein [Bacillus phage Kirov]